MSEERKQALKQELAKNRLRLRTLLMRLNEEQWNTIVFEEGEDEHAQWKVIEIVRHLTDSERGIMGNARNILKGTGGVPEDFDRDRWNASRLKKLVDKQPKELLQSMAENRAALLEMIDGLEDGDLDKEGRHADLSMMTVERLLRQIALHEEVHASQIAGALGLKSQ